MKNWLLESYGYLQVDGYAGYEQTGATLVGCFAHARRNFIEVQRAQVKGKTGIADWAISHIRKLYRIESEIKDKDPAAKQAQRLAKAKPMKPSCPWCQSFLDPGLVRNLGKYADPCPQCGKPVRQSVWQVVFIVVSILPLIAITLFLSRTADDAGSVSISVSVLISGGLLSI